MKEELEQLFLEKFEKIDSFIKISYPIYIPSKARSNIKITTSMLDDCDISYYLVVEPQDHEKYLENYDESRIIAMKENDQGIGYVRRFCKQHSINNGDKFHWQFDDNIVALGIRKDNKNLKYSARNCISIVEDFNDLFTNIGGCGLSHYVYAWARPYVIGFNKQIFTACLFRNTKEHWWKSNTIEDTDYSLQLLSDHLVTLYFNRILMFKAPTGKYKGGNLEIEYGGNKDEKRFGGEKQYKKAQKMQEYWPEAKFQIRVKEKTNEIRLKPSRIWSSFKQLPKNT